MKINLTTDRDLLYALKRSISRRMPAAEREQQAVSFVMGLLPDSNTTPREQVIKVIRREGLN